MKRNVRAALLDLPDQRAFMKLVRGNMESRKGQGAGRKGQYYREQSPFQNMYPSEVAEYNQTLQHPKNL